MKNPRRVVNIGLVVIAIIAIGAAVIAATAGGRSATTGNAQACDAFWSWFDSTSSTASSGVLSAYHEATTQPLTDDLYNVTVGLKDQAKGLNGNKSANAAFAQTFAGKVQTDCTNAGYPDPES